MRGISVFSIIKGDIINYDYVSVLHIVDYKSMLTKNSYTAKV